MFSLPEGVRHQNREANTQYLFDVFFETLRKEGFSSHEVERGYFLFLTQSTQKTFSAEKGEASESFSDREKEIAKRMMQFAEKHEVPLNAFLRPEINCREYREKVAQAWEGLQQVLSGEGAQVEGFEEIARCLREGECGVCSIVAAEGIGRTQKLGEVVIKIDARWNVGLRFFLKALEEEILPAVKHWREIAQVPPLYFQCSFRKGSDEDR